MKVFISYRRADSQPTAGRMAQFLGQVPAVEQVFIDVDDIPLGDDFLHRIRSTLGQATHALLLIGPQWAGGTSRMQPPTPSRLFDADDVLREEVRQALAGPARVVPVLIDGTPMPAPATLPPELQSLPRLNAFELRNAHFDADMDSLLDALLRGQRGRGPRWWQARLTPAGVAVRVLGGAASAGVLLVLVAQLNALAGGACDDLVCRLRDGLGLGSDQDALGLLWLLSLGVLGIGALLPFVPRLRRRLSAPAR